MKRQIFPSGGYAIELRNCLEEAKDSLRAHNAGSQVRIDLALRQGLFVVISRGCVVLQEH